MIERVMMPERLSNGAIAVYIAIMRHKKTTGAELHKFSPVSTQDIMNGCSYTSKNTVRTRLRELEKKGYIKVYSPNNRTGGVANSIRLLKDINGTEIKY